MLSTNPFRSFMSVVGSEEDWEYANSTDDLIYPLRVMGVATDLYEEPAKKPKKLYMRAIPTPTAEERQRWDLEADVERLRLAAAHHYWKRLNLYLGASGVRVHPGSALEKVASKGSHAARVRLRNDDLLNIDDSARDTAKKLVAYFNSTTC